MAITHIHPIVGNVSGTIKYIMNDKIESVRNIDEWKQKNGNIQSHIAYTINDKKGEIVYHTLNTSINCAYPSDILRSMDITIANGRGRYRREAPRSKSGKEIVLYHMWQNFGESISPLVANEIGVKLAKEIFPDFPVVISTHTNTGCTHNHFAICAWNNNGKKWNDCHQTKRQIRSVSDRLCEEYGLQVLDNTKNMNLIKYQDADGKTRYYEPTDRKNKLLQKRKQEMYRRDDIGNYRHTQSYEQWKQKKLSYQEIVRRDIDRLLPDAFSYEHLLSLLREYGYTIRDKKKNGDWLTHVTFILTEASKGVRDSSLSEDGAYTREQLTERIDKKEAERKQRQMVLNEINTELSREEINEIPYNTSYQYGEIDIQRLHPKWRKTLSSDGEILFVKRSVAEHDIIECLKKKDQLDSTIKEEVLLEIQEGLYSLHFLEVTGYATLQDVQIASRKVWADFYNTKEQVGHLDTIIKKVKTVYQLPFEYEKIKHRMELHSNDAIYMQTDYEQDKKTLERYETLMEKYKVKNPEKMLEYTQKLEQCQRKKQKLQLAIECLEHELKDFEYCMKTLERIQSMTGREMEAEQNQKEQKTKVEMLMDEQDEERENSRRKQKEYER